MLGSSAGSNRAASHPDAVGKAVRDGHLSFAFFDGAYRDRLGGMSTTRIAS